MKRFLFYVTLAAIITAVGIFAHKRGYKFGYKAGYHGSTWQKHLEDWSKTRWSNENSRDLRYDPNKPTVKVMTINFDNAPPQLTEIKPIHDIIREKYNIEYVDQDPDILINGFADTKTPPSDPKIIKIHYTSEVYIGDPKKFLDSYDLVTGFDFIDRPNYIRIPFQYISNNDKVNHSYNRGMTCNPSSKKHFACFLVRNSGDWLPGKFDGAEARTRMFHRLSLYKKVLSGGKHLNNVGSPAPDTQEFLSQCKFTLSYENTLNYPGYVTEKPFNAWLAGTVPIYNTDPAGLVDINKKAVIYAGDFKTEEDLVDYIIKVDNDDKLYCDIWNQQIVDNPENDYEVLKAKLRVKLNEIFAKKLNK